MYAMTRAPATAMAPAGIYKLPPPGPLPPPGMPGPLPNFASYSMAVDICLKVTMAGMPACVLPAKIPMSTGDEVAAGGPGGGGGLLSTRIKGECKALQPSMKVFLGGKAGVPMTSSTSHNANNSTGSILGPSQCKVVIG